MSSREAQVADSFSAIAPTYDDHYRSPGDLADNDVIFGRARRLAAQCPPGLFIDFGCGPGTALDWNVADPSVYLGIDVAPGMIEEARHRWPGYSFQVGNHTALPRGGCAFILGGFGPIQYINPWLMPKVATAIVGALVPGGRFLLMGRPEATPTRVLGDDLTYGWSAHWLGERFRQAGAECRVSGYRGWLSRKAGHMSRKVQRDVIRLERLYPLQPHKADWLLVEGHVGP